jgi:hypothetical protein
MEDIQEMKPTVFCGVPRVYDRIYTGTLAIHLLFLLSFAMQHSLVILTVFSLLERHTAENCIWRIIGSETF